MKKKRNLIGVCLVAVLMLALTVIGYAAGDGEAAPEYGAWCLVPPLVTIVLAFVTKQTIISMFIGIWVGATIIHHFNPIDGLIGSFTGYLVPSIADSWNAGMLIIMALIGGFMYMLSACGGAEAFGRWAEKVANNRKKSQLLAWIAPFVFIFNQGCLLVGVIMRPVTDKTHISRVKLAYITDAMGAPLVSMSPISDNGVYLVGLLAAEIAAMAGVKAYIADPVVVDEMEEVARLSGHPDCPRRSIFHALNQKATARLHCDRIGIVYEKANLVVAHLGGGISVAAHKQGRVVDVNNALDGDGPFAPERAGSLPAGEFADLCFSGRYTRREVQKMLAGQGGLVAHLGTNSMMQVSERIVQGDEKARLVAEAMCYGISKQIGAMAAAMCGRVDAVILTGGIAHNEFVVRYIEQHCSFIAPVSVYPGENELESLVANALVVLRGTIVPKVYA